MKKKELKRRIEELERENEVLRADAEAWREMALAVHSPAAPWEPVKSTNVEYVWPGVGRYTGGTALL